MTGSAPYIPALPYLGVIAAAALLVLLTSRTMDVGRGALTDPLRGGARIRREGDDAGWRPSLSLRSLVAALPPGLTVDLDVPEPVGRPSEARLDRAAAETLRRVVQESLTNVLRHAGPDTHVRVTLTVDATHAEVEVEVVDDGARASAAPTPTMVPPSQRPSTPPLPDGAGGRGLVGMRERVARLGGTCQAGPVEPTGWRVRARLPAKAV
ncbi:hypothetical protein BCD48_40345 [Pseudofrankia sp. BMG5.36]|nr:hypothetical protein BCD48_40345 [Pseudofrankia sp. BMG5.36]